MSNLLIDTCFWYAYYESKEKERHDLAVKFIERHLPKDKIIVPHPTLYEVINTKFSKREDWMDPFKKLLTNRNNVKIISDDKYKEEAFSLTFDFSIRKKRPISFVDMIIRLMLGDANLKINALVTFNEKDFSDICYQKNIDLINK
jgi:predicted nucleic acid-binding protein